MQVKQHTLKEKVTLSGIGLHTGLTIHITFCPAPINHGIQFQRIDIANSTPIKALAEYVIDTSRGTTIGDNNVKIGTIEHVLAALTGLEIDNVLIQLNAPEVPIMDGSAQPFIDTLQQVGIIEQDADRFFLKITESIFYRDKKNNIEVVALPLDTYRITVMIDYSSPALGSQHASLSHIQDFKKEIAACRTFCFLHELEHLYRQNLIKGGDLSNAIVIVDKKITESELARLSDILQKPYIYKIQNGLLNNAKLKYKNEPARHKLLDLMGDLALVGAPIKAQILAARPGHASNVAFAKKLRKYMLTKNQNIPKYDHTKQPVLDIKQITNILPHRYPFQLVDKILKYDQKSIIGIKNVTINEPFFEGHFPGNPVMPGVLQIEALAQTGGILVLSTVPDPENYWTYFLGIDNCRFKKIVLPGDIMLLQCTLITPIKFGFSKMNCKAFVNNELVCEATLSAKIIKKNI